MDDGFLGLAGEYLTIPSGFSFMRSITMSRFNNLRIAKGGKLLADEWIYNKETQEGKMDRGIDVTELFMYRLRDNCTLEDDVIFRDVLLLIESLDEYTALSPMLTCGPWLKDIVDEGLIGESDTNSQTDNITIGWAAAVEDDFYNEGQSEFTLFTNVYGTGKENTETWALDFTPAYQLVDHTITLDREFSIEDEQKGSLKGRREYLDSLTEEERSEERYYPTIVKTNKSFTLYDIIYGLFWELSFHGSPKDRDLRTAELTETMRKIKSGEAKCTPWEDVKERIKGETK